MKIVLSVLGDLDGMTVGNLRYLLKDISDTAEIHADWDEYANPISGSQERFYNIVIEETKG